MNRERGYTMIGFMLIVFGLTTVSIVVATNFLSRFSARSQSREERTLPRIKLAFATSVARTQTIPTHTNWLTELAAFTDLDQTGLRQSHPEWGSNSALTRVFLVDTNLPSTLLPYRQPAGGLSGSATNLLRTAARVLIVSSTRRDVTMPVSSGVAASNVFNAIWDWRYDPATKAPPTGWSSWTGLGEFIHVERINLASLFHRVAMQNLKYGVAGVSSVTNAVSTVSTQYFLHGTPLVLATSSGTIKRAHVVTRDTSIILESPSTPYLYYAFNETSGTTANNSGTAGATANGTHMKGVILVAAGPRPPSFPVFTSGNLGIQLDGGDDYVQTKKRLLDNFSAFTLGGWFYSTDKKLENLDFFGQEKVIEIGFKGNNKLTFETNDGKGKIEYIVSYGVNEWHHVAGTGDGTNMHLYVDGALVSSKAYATSTYGASDKYLNIGGNVFGGGHNVKGYMDEIVFYTNALTPAQIALVYGNQLP